MPSTTNNPGKYGDAWAEAADLIAGHGFEDDHFGSTDTINWHALVIVSPTIVRNLVKDDDLADRLDDGEHLVWIEADPLGFVNTKIKVDTANAEREDVMRRTWQHCVRTWHNGTGSGA